MDETTAATISAVAATVSLPVAVASAVVAWRAGRANTRAADQQNQLGHAAWLGSWQPTVDMVLDAVTYRWATDAQVWEPGEQTDPGLAAGEGVSPDRARDERLHVEVVVSGRLVNHSPREMLATAHALRRRQVRYPLRNQGVFLVDGVDRHQAVIAANSTVAFRWIDRLPVDDWLRHLAVADRWAAFDVPIPLRRRDRARSPQSGGFCVVLDSRAAERVSEVWTAILERPAVQPCGRDDRDQLLWAPAESASAPIDDDVIRYRCAADSTLAQLRPPRLRLVPGRL
ncbi:MAG: hypothetical protein ACTHMH_08265 [Curtobacterium sp.]